MRRSASNISILFAATFYCLSLAGARSQDWGTPQSRGGKEYSSNSLPSFSILVRDVDGVPIFGAVATISELWVEKSDQNGMVRVESKAGMRFPVSIVVSARGYQTRQLLMTSSRFENLEVNLPRLENTPHSGMTVSLSELSPENQATSTSFQQKAIQALQQGDHIRAEQLLRKAIELTPSIGMLYNNLGVAVLRQGRMGEAITWFEKAYEISPYDRGTNGNLGLMRWMQKRTDESYQLLDKAVALGFSTPTAHYYLGILALARGQWKLSVEQLSRTDGNRFRYRDLFLAQALSGMGRQKESLNSFQKHMSRNPVHYYIYVPSYRTQTAADLSSPLQSQPSANAHILPH